MSMTAVATSQGTGGLPGILVICGLSLSGCAASVPVADQPRGAQEIRVAGFQHWQGLEARRQADAQCGPRGVRVSIYDRYQAGAWVYPEGCA